MLVVTLPCATIIILLHTTAVHERQGCGSDSVQLRFSGRHIHPSSFRYFLYVRYSYSGIISVHFICLGFYDLLLYWYHFFHFDAEKFFCPLKLLYHNEFSKIAALFRSGNIAKMRQTLRNVLKRHLKCRISYIC